MIVMLCWGVKKRTPGGRGFWTIGDMRSQRWGTILECPLLWMAPCGSMLWPRKMTIDSIYILCSFAIFLRHQSITYWIILSYYIQFTIKTFVFWEIPSSLRIWQPAMNARTRAIRLYVGDVSSGLYYILIQILLVQLGVTAV